MERIRIKNFGGIKDLDIELGKINLFIGQQASGKSVLVKLIFFFRNIVGHVIESYQEDETHRGIASLLERRFREFFPSESWPKLRFMILYQIGENEIVIDRIHQFRLDIRWSEKLTEIFNIVREQTTSQATELYVELMFRTRTSLFERISKKFPEILPNSSLFVPAGRSFFSTIQGNVFSFIASNKTIDPFLAHFGANYIRAKDLLGDNFMGFDEKQVARMNQILDDIIGAHYVKEKSKDYLKHTDGRKVGLNYSSSGQQELFPLILILQSLNLHFEFIRIKLVFIEEPEAHLFPKAQIEITNLLARTFNERKGNLQLMITTHSPYVLTAFNVLIQAGKAQSILKSKRSKLGQLYKIVPKDVLLAPGSVFAYSMQDGSAKSIIDKETGLINAEYIDSISETTAGQFDQILELL